MPAFVTKIASRAALAFVVGVTLAAAVPAAAAVHPVTPLPSPGHLTPEQRAQALAAARHTLVVRLRHCAHLTPTPRQQCVHPPDREYDALVKRIKTQSPPPETNPHGTPPPHEDKKVRVLSAQPAVRQG